MKKTGILWSMIVFILLAGCSTSPDEVKDNMDKVIIENIERNFSHGVLYNDGKIEWMHHIYIITEMETTVDKMIGDINETKLLDKSTGSFIPKVYWNAMDPALASQQNRLLLRFGFLYAIPDKDVEEAIAVEINHTYYIAKKISNIEVKAGNSDLLFHFIKRIEKKDLIKYKKVVDNLF